VEENIWRAVIQQAWRDYFEHQDVEAECFLFDTYGDWYQSRKDICAAVEVDPDNLREWAIRERASKQ